MPIIEISSLTDSGVEIFSTLTEAQLRNRIEPDKGLLIAESPKVIHVALNAGYEPLALLCEQKHITGDAAGIIERCGDIPVYTGERKLLATLTGYTLTRGVLCAMRRRALPSVEEVCRKARRIVVIEGVVDATNIGAIFRSAAALGKTDGFRLLLLCRFITSSFFSVPLQFSIVTQLPLLFRLLTGHLRKVRVRRRVRVSGWWLCPAR